MGTRVAPSFAINFMAWFEETFVYTYHTQPMVWLRYIDDIFLIWTRSRDELNTFIQHLNSRIPSIKFTEEVSQESVTFLDTTAKIRDGRIETDLYTKPTDSHNYLLYTSAHPKSCRNSIPYSQFLRIRRICSNLADFDRHACQYATYFLNRGYPTHIIEEAVLKTRRLDRNELLNAEPSQKPKQDTDNMILTTTYHPQDNTLREIVSRHWDFLGKSTNTQKLHKKHLMVGYRRPKNLRDLLVRADVRDKTPKPRINTHNIGNDAAPAPPPNASLIQKNIRDYFTRATNPVHTNHNITSTASVGDLLSRGGCSNKPCTPTARGKNICRNKKCRYCPLLDTSGTLICHATGEKHQSMRNISCQSSNLIYCMSCRTCEKQYVGQTKRKLYLRFQGHFYNIKVKKQSDAIGMHFSQADHRGTSDMIIRVMEFISLPPQSMRSLALRLRVEKKWIHTLRCPAPTGLNIFD